MTDGQGKLAFVFPGQGSQYAGMGRELADTYPEARRVFEVADESLEFPLSTLCFEGPDEALTLTENTQPAILATSAATSSVLAAAGIRPDFVAGHSLGEYSAVVAGGGLELGDALRLVRQRGRYMQQAVSVGEGAMAAVLGLTEEAVAALCDEAAAGEVVEPANLNGGGQVVIAGHRDAVERACGLAKSRGAKRAMMLAVSAPFHCRLMAPAAEQLAGALQETAFSNLDVPLVTNVDAVATVAAEEVRDALRRQVASPVRWEQSVLRMAEAGVDTFVEVGPGKVLSGLVRKIIPGANVHTLDAPDGLSRFLEEARVV